MRQTSNLALVACSAFILTLSMSTALAGSGQRSSGGNYVTARSEFGGGKISAPVRNSKYGPQVQLPGGAWVYCETSCSETLRVKTVDFAYSEEALGPDNALTNDGGILGRLGIQLGR